MVLSLVSFVYLKIHWDRHWGVFFCVKKISAEYYRSDFPNFGLGILQGLAICYIITHEKVTLFCLPIEKATYYVCIHPLFSHSTITKARYLKHTGVDLFFAIRVNLAFKGLAFMPDAKKKAVI